MGSSHQKVMNKIENSKGLKEKFNLNKEYGRVVKTIDVNKIRL